MSSAVFTSDSGVAYTDKKRHLWYLSYLVPVVSLIGPVIYMQTGAEWPLWFLMVFAYAIVPAIDWLLGEDLNNPPEEVVAEMEKDTFYRWLVISHIPVVFALFLFFAWFAATQELTIWGYIATALSAGLISGFGLNVGHELGHKKEKLEQWLAKIVLAPAMYGHFFTEHNKGHHKYVATPLDPASSRMGENIFSFSVRELPGAIIRAHRIEKERLIEEGKSPWRLENEFLHSLLMTFAFYAFVVMLFGLATIPFLVVAAFFAMWQLTSANYIEHYGLLRQKTASGRYESPKPHHSWNSNHIFSNLLLFHLQRHSDHHANARRRYQSLRHFENLPSLPSGYFGMYLIAYFPPLWFKLMDQRLIDATGGDANQINFLPSKRDALIRKHGLKTD